MPLATLAHISVWCFCNSCYGTNKKYINKNWCRAIVNLSCRVMNNDLWCKKYCVIWLLIRFVVWQNILWRVIRVAIRFFSSISSRLLFSTWFRCRCFVVRFSLVKNLFNSFQMTHRIFINWIETNKFELYRKIKRKNGHSIWLVFRRNGTIQEW